ncbi:MAG: phosphatidate cytidylyltransferase [Acidobacteria bacterium]|nr:phosphatidate cytidylyltransferase [Acidobacteriota bacterium]
MARVLSAILLLPILFGVLWWGAPIWFILIAALAILLGLYEYYGLTGRDESFSSTLGCLLAACAVLSAFYYQRSDLIVVIIAALVILELLGQLYIHAGKEDFSQALGSVAVQVFGVLYLVLPGGYMIALRLLESSVPNLAVKALTLFFLIIFAGDTGAYYTGRTLGRHKLAPRISPGKTIEGAVGGLTGSILAAVIAHFTFFPELKIEQAIPLAIFMGLLGIAGDLCESMIKRGAKAKDAGKLIPGHGGLLDRLDSMLFNAPVIYYFCVIFMP